MYLTKDTVAEIKKHHSEFISFKFIDLSGRLLQFDALYKNFIEGDACIYGEDFSLKPFATIKDPFRSSPTTSVFCEKIEPDDSFREKLSDRWSSQFQRKLNNDSLKINLWQHFFVTPLELTEKSNYMLATDPVDRLADMRSDIFSILSNVNIDTTFHFHGKLNNECVVGIKNKNLVDLADKLLILRYVIKNVAISYGYKVSFAQEDLTNLRLELFSNNEFENKLLLKLVDKSNSLMVNCPEMKELDLLNKKNKKLQNNQGEEIVFIEFVTKDDFNPYLSLLNLIS